MQLLQSVSAKGVVRRQESQARVEIDAHGQVVPEIHTAPMSRASQARVEIDAHGQAVPEIHTALLNRASQGTAEAEMNE